MTTDERNIVTIKGQDIVAMAYGGGVWYGVSRTGRRLVEINLDNVAEPVVYTSQTRLPFPPLGVAMANRSGRNGVHRRIYDGEFLRGAPIGSDVDDQVEFSRDSQDPANALRDARLAFNIDVNHYSFELDFWYVAPETGDFRFTLASDDGVRVYWNGVKVVESWRPQNPAFDEPSRQWSDSLVKGQAVRVKVEYANSVAPTGSYTFRYHIGDNPPANAENDPKVPASDLFLPYRVSTRIDDPLDGEVGTEILPDIGAAVVAGRGQVALFSTGAVYGDPILYRIPHITGVIHGAPSGQVLLGTNNSLILANADQLDAPLAEHDIGFTPKIMFTDPDQNHEVWVIDNDGQYARVTTKADAIQVVDKGVFEHARDVVDGYAYSPTPADLPDNRLLSRYGWQQSPITGYWYRVSPDQLPWEDVQEYAGVRGAQLAVFDAQSENDWVAATVHLPVTGSKWIGLYNVTYPGATNYQWVDGTTLQFTAWFTNQPPANSDNTQGVYLFNNRATWVARVPTTVATGIMQIKDPCELTPDQWSQLAEDVGVEACDLAAYGWIQSPNTGFWYRSLGFQVGTWDEWAQHAANVGGILACPGTEQENQWLHDTVLLERFPASKWIGLVNARYPTDPDEQDYVWYDGTPRTYSAWADNEPGPGGDLGYACILRSGEPKWADRARTTTGNNFRGIVQINDPSTLTEEQWDAIAGDAGKPLCIAPGTRRDTCDDGPQSRTITLVEENNATALYSLDTVNDTLVPTFVNRADARGIKALAAWGLSQGLDAVTVQEFLATVRPELDSTIKYPFDRTQAISVRQGIVVAHAKSGVITVFHDTNVDPPVGVDFPFFPQADVEYSFRAASTSPVEGPTAAASLTNTLLEVTADASASVPGTYPIETYTFDWGTGDITGPQASPVASYEYLTDGPKVVTITVSDIANLTSETVQLISLAPLQPPTAVVTTTEVSRLGVSVSAIGSQAGSGPISNYLFDFGDGVTQASATPGPVNHVYASSDTYTVSVVVTDVFGLSDTASTTYTPAPGPTAVLSLSAVGGLVTADATLSIPGDFPIVSYQFDWGDGTTSSSSNGIASYLYPSDGLKTVTVTVTDSDNNPDTATDDITVAIPSPPNADLTVVSAGLDATADASGSIAGDLPISTYTFDWGDGTTTGPQANPIATHTYATEGVKVVSVTVQDTQAGEDTFTTTRDIVAAQIYLRFRQLPGPPLTNSTNDARLSMDNFTFLVRPDNVSVVYPYVVVPVQVGDVVEFVTERGSQQGGADFTGTGSKTDVWRYYEVDEYIAPDDARWSQFFTSDNPTLGIAPTQAETIVEANSASVAFYTDTKTLTAQTNGVMIVSAPLQQTAATPTYIQDVFRVLSVKINGVEVDKTYGPSDIVTDVVQPGWSAGPAYTYLRDAIGPTAVLGFLQFLYDSRAPFLAYARATAVAGQIDGRLTASSTITISNSGVNYMYFVIQGTPGELVRATVRLSGGGGIVYVYGFEDFIEPTDPAFTNPPLSEAGRQLGRTPVSTQVVTVGNTPVDIIDTLPISSTGYSTLVLAAVDLSSAVNSTFTLDALQIGGYDRDISNGPAGTVTEDDGQGPRAAYTVFAEQRGLNARVTSAGSIPGDLPIQAFTFEMAGKTTTYTRFGSSGPGLVFAPSPGTYSVLLTVYDSLNLDGLSDTDTINITFPAP